MTEKTRKKVARMINQGYRFRFIADGDLSVLKPDGTRYEVSLTGRLGRHIGCDCYAGEKGIVCKHKLVAVNFRPCDEPTCQSGTMVYHEAETLGGTSRFFECGSCGKTTDARIVEDLRKAPVAEIEFIKQF